MLDIAGAVRQHAVVMHHHLEPWRELAERDLRLDVLLDRGGVVERRKIARHQRELAGIDLGFERFIRNRLRERHFSEHHLFKHFAA